VERDFSAQLFSAHASKVTRDTRNRIIGSGDQDDLRSEKVSSQAAMRFSRSDKSHRAPRGRFASGDDDTYLPTKLM